MSDNIQDYDLKDELIAERKVGYFEKPADMSGLTYKIIINIDKTHAMDYQKFISHTNHAQPSLSPSPFLPNPINPIASALDPSCKPYTILSP